ncbi:aurora kinase A and ninein-interacting protein-like [Eublepharis macularius]|uniref:Aurora kinase A and ninein-interacting protein-like n=1 Tax=Eublepharis macularius TaxID=481883 RepID=A0AA97LH53_EUBMA|nr:aurora kinase A and ninein-interacting protein-like [Eublepharis macularius]
MKRKGRSPTEQQHEACDIWLDPSAFKKRKMQTLIAKSALRVKNRPLLYPGSEKVPLPFTKQTTISTFFRSQSSDEKKTNTNRGLLSIASKSDCSLQRCESLEGERSQLAASLFPPIQEFKLIQHYTHQTSAQSDSRSMALAKEKSTADDNLDSTQRPEANGVTEHTAVASSPLRGKNGGQRTFNTPYSLTNQNRKALRRNGNCSSHSKNHLSDSSDSENIDSRSDRCGTAMKWKGFNQNGTGILSEIALCSSDKGSKNSQLGCATSLFSQDSEGHRVISHRFSGEQRKLCLPKQPLQDKSNQGASPAYRDCFGACFPAQSGLQLAAGMNLPAQAENRLKSCYDLLFTEDSEGNRVIKH